jgi:hypothetical protein
LWSPLSRLLAWRSGNDRSSTIAWPTPLLKCMYRLFELKEAFITARSSAGRIAVDPADGETFKRVARERKAARLNEMTECWNKFIEAVARVELWEDDFCKPDVDVMKDAVFELARVFPDYNSWEDKGWGADEEMGKLHRKWRGELYGTADDEFGKLFAQRVENVKAACKGLVR